MLLQHAIAEKMGFAVRNWKSWNWGRNGFRRRSLSTRWISRGRCGPLWHDLAGTDRAGIGKHFILGRIRSSGGKILLNGLACIRDSQ